MSKENKSTAELPDSVWCPICDSKLDIKEKDGKITLTCPQHGEMNAYMSRNPKASVQVRKGCAPGVAGLEAC